MSRDTSSVEPQDALPNVMVPSASGLTTRPERPKVRKDVSFMGVLRWVQGFVGVSPARAPSRWQPPDDRRRNALAALKQLAGQKTDLPAALEDTAPAADEAHHRRLLK